MASIPMPNHEKIEKVSNNIINNIPRDVFAPKRNIKSNVDQYSTFSPKKSNLVASTKHQTFAKSQHSFT